MNIAIITNKPYGNSETFIKAQIDHLPFNCFHYWGTAIPFQLKPNIKTSFFHKLLSKVKTKKSNSEDLFIHDLNKHNIQLVLAHYGMMGTLVFNVCQKLNLPLVVHFHGHDAVRKSVVQSYRESYKNMFNYPKLKIISVSHEMTNRLIALGCPKEKILYNTYGPNKLFLSLTPLYSQKQFVFIGRFVEKKAPHLLLLAFKKSLEKHPDIKLIMAGDGPLLDSCISLTKALQIEDEVYFPGHISPERYMSFLANSLAYIQHSIEAEDGDMEGTPVSILEASAAGLPVISTIHAGIPDVIIHQKTGLLSQELDIDAMSQNMNWLIENKNLAIEMGQMGKKHINANFSFQKHINGLEEILKKCL
tara:strand:+ start:11446 stop:12528 length:1083 start_codon:yes stop_codon:yes gene_type:complete